MGRKENFKVKPKATKHPHWLAKNGTEPTEIQLKQPVVCSNNGFGPNFRAIKKVRGPQKSCPKPGLKGWNYPIRQSQQRSILHDTLIARPNPRDPIFSLALPRHSLCFAAPPDPAVMDFRHVSWMSWHRTRGPSRSPKKPRRHPLRQRLARFEVCSSLGGFLSLAFPELALPRFLGG